jgi:hypothetical protein
MKNSNLKLFVLLLSLTVATVSCEKEDEGPDTGTLIMEFDNVAGAEELELNTKTYTNAQNEEFQVTMLQYYVSNVKLTTSDGKEYVVPQDSSYFLVRENDQNSQMVKINNVPSGDYSSVTFTIGVDSVRCTSSIDKRTGVLDVGDENTGKGMYWTWNSGYIHFRVEGTSPQSSHELEGKKVFFYHVGGFGGFDSPTVNNIRTTTLNIGNEKAKVRRNKTSAIHIKADVLKVFNGDVNISFAANPFSHFTAWSSHLADHYVKMFSVEHVHNE